MRRARTIGRLIADLQNSGRSQDLTYRKRPRCGIVLSEGASLYQRAIVVRRNKATLHPSRTGRPIAGLTSVWPWTFLGADTGEPGPPGIQARERGKGLLWQLSRRRPVRRVPARKTRSGSR